MMTLSRFVSAALLVLAAPSVALATNYDVNINGTDAIWLAGRTDLVIPNHLLSWTDGLLRHDTSTPEELTETMPSFVPVSGGDTVTALAAATGLISYFNGFGAPPLYGPRGDLQALSGLTSFGGIGPYNGPQGGLVGVFLSDAVPDGQLGGAAPSGGLGGDLRFLTPALRQVFYIGDGRTAGGDFKQVTAPLGATRLFLGIADGFVFSGAPGAYDDDDGLFRISLSVTGPVVPEPAAGVLLALGLGAGLLAAGRRRPG